MIQINGLAPAYLNQTVELENALASKQTILLLNGSIQALENKPTLFSLEKGLVRSHTNRMDLSASLYSSGIVNHSSGGPGSAGLLYTGSIGCTGSG